jgi:hypothetical protein
VRHTARFYCSGHKEERAVKAVLINNLLNRNKYWQKQYDAKNELLNPASQSLTMSQLQEGLIRNQKPIKNQLFGGMFGFEIFVTF